MLDSETLPSPAGSVTTRLSAPSSREALRDLLTRLFYHRRAASVAFAVPVLFALGAAILSKPTYVAEARLLVLYSGAYLYRPAIGQSGDSVALDRNQIILGELQVLQSDLLARETLREVGIDRVYPGSSGGNQRTALGRAAERFPQDLTLTSVPQSNILELGFRSYSPEVAAQVLRVLIRNYLDRRAVVFDRLSPPDKNVDQDNFLHRLDHAEDALQKFAAANGIANLDQQITLLLQQQFATDQARNAAAQHVEETAAKLAVVKAELAAVPDRITGDTETTRSQQSEILTDSLLRLQIKRRDLESHYQDSFPAVQALDRQIAATQAQLSATPAREDSSVRVTVNMVYQNLTTQALSLQAQLSGLQATVASLATQGAATAQRLAALVAAGRHYQDLQRSRDVLDEGYRVVTRSEDVARAAELAERNGAANVRVIQPPETPTSGKSLHKIILAAGLIVGMLAAFTTSAVLYALRQVFVTPRDVVQGLGLQVFGVIDQRDTTL
jgi:uncharacterized protein involved in exopolysaccharide biosynthesis